jgi:Leucine-rich repeat (LRR) protein
VTDAGLPVLAHFESLTELDLASITVTGHGPDGAEGPENAHHPASGRRAVHGHWFPDPAPDRPAPRVDRGLEELRDLKNLTSLSLRSTGITDEGLQKLASFPNLLVLDLSETRITDKGLAQLKALKNLARVDLSDTPVTDAGLKELCQALPRCRVVKRVPLPLPPIGNVPDAGR